MATKEDLKALISVLPGSDAILDVMLEQALAMSVVPDSFGIWPGREGYETTHDIYYAALTLMGFLQAQPYTTSASSEGTSVTVKAPDWKADIESFRNLSRICGAQGNDVLTVVPIPDGPHVIPVYMGSMGGGDNGDVDTDLG